MSSLSFARAQMAVSLGFHMVFAAIGIAMPLMTAIAQWLHQRTGKEHYLELTRRWAKATGLLFAVGAISGTALAFELGLLWPRYMELTGAVVGHLFALEGYAFFIEAIFIGLYLYGWDRLSPRAHWWCIVVIAVSGAISGVLVLGVNSWMQLPVGFVRDSAGHVTVTDPLAIFKRYGWFVMSLHSTLSCYLAIAFAAAGVYALEMLTGNRKPYVKSALRICLAVGAISAILQPISGDLLAKFVYQTQPAKFAAMEENYITRDHAPVQIGEGKLGIQIPGMLSFLADHRFDARVIGLNDIPRNDWPNVTLTHVAFDVMVGLGTLLMFVGIAFWWMQWRNAGAMGTWMLRAIALAAPCGILALEAGWIVTEVGRQPWVINGVMRTADAVTTAPGIGGVFAEFMVLYVILACVVVRLLARLAHHTIEPPQMDDAVEA